MTLAPAPDTPTIAPGPSTRFGSVASRPLHRPLAVFGLAVIVAVVVAATAAPLLAPFSPDDQLFDGLTLEGAPLPPNGHFLLGTDRVRKAVNLAINKDRIIKIINGRAVPAGQPLPPGMPGFDKDYKGYAYDVDKGEGPDESRGLRRRCRYGTLRLQHRSQSAHRASDPTGPRCDRHPRPDQIARPGECHRRSARYSPIRARRIRGVCWLRCRGWGR